MSEQHSSRQQLESLSDEVLMSRYQEGEALAFEVLFDRHQGRVLSYLRKRITNEKAQELCQESFLKLHRARHQYQERYPFLPWLFTIVRNSLLDDLKRAETRLQHQTEGGSQALIDLIPANNPRSPEEGEFAALLRELPEKQKRALELRYMQDWSFEEIGRELNLTASNVRQVISRAVKLLKKNRKEGSRG